MSLADRWNGYLRRRADALVRRADMAAMRQGLLPAGWVYGLNDQRQAQYDEQRRIMLELHKNLFREPVTGPDGIAVALWYESAPGYRAPLVAPIRPWPGAQKDPLTATVGRGARMLNFLVSSPRLPFVVHAHAMSGPPAAVIRVFPSKNEAAAFAAELAQRVRASGVEALSQPPHGSG